MPTKRKPYDFKKLEPKWQKAWDKADLYKAKGRGRKWYSLIEFPYPSGDGLHVGHVRSNTAMDIVSRKRRMEGYDVLYPIGWDAFGLPTENYAIKTGVDPAVATKENTDTFRRQLKSLGFSFDWSREINTTDPEYYKWTQWMFLQFFKKGLAYKAAMPINWCPKDKIGLANEEAVGGVCDRCGGPVEKRMKEQWMIKITAYAEELLSGLKDLDYISRAKVQQENWIGRSEGAELNFEVSAKGSKINYVLLHGYKGSPEKAQYRWLRENLVKRGYRVSAPQLPNPNAPRENEQVEYILENVKFDQDTVIYGKSLGAVVALKVVERLNSKIRGLVLAGGFLGPDGLYKPHNFDDTFSWNFNFKKIKENVGSITILSDLADKYAVKPAQGRAIHARLGGQLVEVVAREHHFDADEEPAILEALIPQLNVFTTRPDTLFGATYMVVAPEHPLIERFRDQIKNYDEVAAYISRAKAKSELERTEEDKEKTGVELKGLSAVNPASGKEIPIWAADYVLSTYGTGAIMAVPAHDERDFNFAKKYHLPIIQVVKPPKPIEEDLYTGAGELVNSGKFTGLDSEKGKAAITEFVGGTLKNQYRLRDWVFSRQRYWGEPIPLVNCPECGWVAVPDKDLPVELPKVENYQPRDDGESPLASVEGWVKTVCPECGGQAERETDTMPNWAGSSWYFLRYCDPSNNKKFADPKKLKYFMPVDWYNGGMEHTVLHLLYSRFWNRFLYDLGLVPSPEPYAKRTSHGLILAAGGVKMSKSKGNVINPDDIVSKFGADSLRLYEMFLGPFDQAIAWDMRGILGVHRFLERVWRLGGSVAKEGDEPRLEAAVARLIKKVGDDIENMAFNTAISAMMIFVNECAEGPVPISVWKRFLAVLAPFAPHIAEELWSELGYKRSIHLESWPSYDEKLLSADNFTLVIQVNGKVRDSLLAPIGLGEAEALAMAMESEKVKMFLGGAKPIKVVYVPGRLINLVI